VILVIDNDDGAKGVFNVVKSSGGPVISLTWKEPFYYLFANLYLVKTPEMYPDPVSCIEDFFNPELFKTKINGKTFDPKKKHGASDKYGKFVFAEHVVKPKADTIDFSGFSPLLNRIVAALQDYETRKVDLAHVG
jgi:RNA-directed DNA polymerase